MPGSGNCSRNSARPRREAINDQFCIHRRGLADRGCHAALWKQGFPRWSDPDAEPAEWAKHLRLVRHIGFTEVDPTDTWVRVGDLSPQRLADFKSVLSEVGLTIPAISTSRRSVMDPAHGEEYRWSGRDWPSKRGRWRRAAGTLLLSISTRTAWPA
jgi:hypothetical protein